MRISFIIAILICIMIITNSIMIFYLVNFNLNANQLLFRSVLSKCIFRKQRTLYMHVGQCLILLILIVPILRFFKKYKKATIYRNITLTVPLYSHSRINTLLFFIFGTVLSLFVVSYPLSHYYPVPGGDAVAYVAIMKKGTKYGINWLIMNRERVLLGLILCSIYCFSRDCSFSLLILHFISTLLLLINTYYFLSRAMFLKRNVSYIASIFVILLPSYLWYLGDLYASLFAYSILYGYFAYFLKYCTESEKIIDLSLLLAVLSLIVIGLSHQETFFIAILISLVYLMFETLYQIVFVSSRKLFMLLKKATLIFVLAIIFLSPFIFLSLFNVNYFGPFSRYIGPVEQRYGIAFLKTKISNFFGVASTKSWHDDPYWGDYKAFLILFQEYDIYQNICLLTLVMAGFLLIDISTPWGRLLFSWIIALCTLILLSSLRIITIPTPGRISLLLPYAVGIAMSINYIDVNVLKKILSTRLCVKIRIIKCNRKSVFFYINLTTVLKWLFLILIFLYSFNVSIRIETRYFSNAIYTIGAPELRVIHSIELITSIFGYGNETIIIMVKSNEGRLVEWVSALTGAKIYYGKMAFLLANKTLEDPVLLKGGAVALAQWNNLRICGVFKNPLSYTIVISENLYAPSTIERRFLIPLKDGIYILRPLNKSEIAYLLKNTSDP